MWVSPRARLSWADLSDGQLGGTLHLSEHTATASPKAVAFHDNPVITIIFIPAAGEGTEPPSITQLAQLPTEPSRQTYVRGICCTESEATDQSDNLGT